MFSAIRAKLTPDSIRAQLMLWYLLMLAGALAAFAAFVFSVRAQTLNREAETDLQLRAQSVARNLRPRLLELDVQAALADDSRLVSEPVAVRERSGAVVFRSPAFPPLSVPAEAVCASAARTGADIVTIEDRTGVPVRVATVVVERLGASPLAVQLTASTEATRSVLRELALALAFWFVVVLSVASYGGSFIAQRALRPVEAIDARVRAIQASSLADRLDVRTGSVELDRLVATLNAMLDRIEGSVHAARRFAADASHELQTPIAAMRMGVEVCLKRGADANGCGIAADFATDLDRLSALVRDLRLLALADAGHLVDRAEPVDLTRLVHECCDIVRAIAEPRAIAVSIDVLSDAVVSGSARHLHRAILNLAQNAVRYSPDGAAVHLTVGRLEGEAVIAVADHGCGIGSADLPHIFERFYRADPARARHTGGTGLGLAIADQIVRSHGGRIDVTSSVGDGSTFLVFLPATAAVDRSADDAHPVETVNAA
jgi:signal transduction histidine kinase